MSTPLRFLRFYRTLTFWVCRLRLGYSALFDRAVDAYDRGKAIKVDLKDYRKKQRVKMNEIQVSPLQLTLDIPWGTERNCY
jgi:hypothetical protein